MPRVRATLAVTILVLTCAACSGKTDNQPVTIPSETATETSASPSPSVPPELANYSAEERAAYAASVSALHRFSDVNDRFLAQGKLTKSQASFYRRYSTDWVADWANLSRLVNEGVTFRGSPTEIWLRPVSIDLIPRDRQVVVVNRCLDQSRLRVFANGVKVPQPQLKVPRAYRVTMVQTAPEPQWRVGLAKQGPPC